MSTVRCMHKGCWRFSNVFITNGAGMQTHDCCTKHSCARDHLRPLGPAHHRDHDRTESRPVTIPKIIHQIWLGSDIPKQMLENASSWIEHNPGWKYNIWTRPLDDMVNQDLYDSAHSYVHGHSVWQMRADLMRYEILYRYGGFYADMDTVCLRPIDEALEGRTEWAVAEDVNWVANTLLAAQPQHPIMETLIESLHAHAQNFEDAAATVVSGPQYMTPIWNDMGGFVDERTHLFYPYSWRHVRSYSEKSVEIPEDAFTVHLWEHARSRRKHTDRAARKK